MATDGSVISAGIPLTGSVTPQDTLETGGPVSALNLNAPIRGFRFLVDFSGFALASFKSVDGGFAIELETSEYREGGFQRLTKRKVPGLATTNDITMQKGVYQDSMVMHDYVLGYYSGANVTPIPDATITLFNTNGTPSARWVVVNPWPTKYEFGNLAADSSEVIIETITFVHEGVYRTLPNA